MQTQQDEIFHYLLPLPSFECNELNRHSRHLNYLFGARSTLGKRFSKTIRKRVLGKLRPASYASHDGSNTDSTGDVSQGIDDRGCDHSTEGRERWDPDDCEGDEGEYLSAYCFEQSSVSFPSKRS